MVDSSLLLVGAVGFIIAVGILVYGAYWAFTMRRALFLGAYRSQALWLGFFCLYIIPHAVSFDSVVMALNSKIADFANEIYYFLLAALLFRLIDVDVGIARKSDPLLREVLHWKRLRVVVWGIMTFSIVSLTVLAIADILEISEPTQLMIPLQASVYVSFLVSGSSALLVGARRSGDPVLRRSLKWFGLFFLALLASTAAYFLTASGLVSISQDTVTITAGYFFVPASYCLYRSAKLLAPMGKLSSSE